MSESSELLAELAGHGLNYADVGRALGRDRSLVRQVALGAKPGNNLADSLRVLRDRLAGVPAAQSRRAAEAVAVPAPARRTTKAGTAAHVRRRSAWEGRASSTTLVKRQGARGQAAALLRQVDRAAGTGREVAATASFDKSVTVNNTSGGRRHGAGGVVMNLGDADEFREALAASGMTPGAFVSARMAEAGYITGDNPAAHLESLELRTF